MKSNVQYIFNPFNFEVHLTIWKVFIEIFYIFLRPWSIDQILMQALFIFL